MGAGLSSPSDIVVSPQYPGSPTADVTWCFPGESSHPSFFTVKVKTENEKVVYKTSVAAGKSSDISSFTIIVKTENGEEVYKTSVAADKRTAPISGLCPLTSYKIIVIAIHQDNIEKETSLEYTHSELCSPSDIVVSPQYPGSSKADVEWSFPIECSDLSSFTVMVETDNGKEVYKTSVAADKRTAPASGLYPLTSYKVIVMADYQNNVKKETSLEYTHTDLCSPSDIVVSPQYPGSPKADVTWCFSGECSDLSSFTVMVKSDNGKEVYKTSVATDKRTAPVSGLYPLTSYKIIVMADYQNNVKKETSLEYTHSDLYSPCDIVVTPKYPGSPMADVQWFFPGNSSDLRSFTVMVKTENGEVVYKTSVAAADNSGTTVKRLRPKKTYQFTVIADYQDNFKKETTLKFEHAALPPPPAAISTDSFILTNDGGTYSERDSYGYELKFSPGFLPDGVHESKITIMSHVPTDDYQLPVEGYVLVSGVYKMQSEKITLKNEGYFYIDYCSESTDSTEVCVVENRGKGHEGKYEYVPEERYEVNPSSVRITLKELEPVSYAAVQNESTSGCVGYYGLLYRLKKEASMSTTLEFHFIIVRALSLMKKAVGKEYVESLEIGNYSIVFDGSIDKDKRKLTLHIWKDGIKSNGWTILSDSLPAEITEMEARSYSPNTLRIPHCKLEASTTGIPNELKHYIEVIGISNLSHLLLHYNPYHNEPYDVAENNVSWKQLLDFKGGSRPINFPREIGTSFTQFGIHLLQDHHGSVVEAIITEHDKNALKINMEILMEWIRGKGKKPANWRTLRRVLQKIELTVLADEIDTAKNTGITMRELLHFECETEYLDIPKAIGEKYSELGCHLLEEEKRVIDIVATEHQHDAYKINKDILQKWLDGKGKKPISQCTLTKVLRKIELTELACKIDAGNDRGITMRELLHFKSENDIPTKIGKKYTELGRHLLKEQQRVIDIEAEHRHSTFKINKEILKEWIRRKGNKPASWRTLSIVLREIDLTKLADEIDAANDAGNITMPELLYFIGKRGCLNFPKEISTDYNEFGLLLLEDSKGTLLKAIVRKYGESAFEINMDILMQWLRGKGKNPTSWRTLSEVLRQIRLTELANEVDYAKNI